MSKRTVLIAAWLMLCHCGFVQADEPLSTLEEQAIQAAVERVAPAVVRIETVGGVERVGQLELGTAPSTGLVLSADGYVVASALNFSRSPDSILVTVPGDNRVAAKLVAQDYNRQLVLLKIEPPRPLPVLEGAPLDQIRIGQWAIALGRSYDDAAPSVSVGLISAVNRIWSKAIQTDAKISPNNYGGPLIDIHGRVIGVISALGPDMMGGVGAELYDSGIGFAIPFADIQALLPRWKNGDLHPGVLGIGFKSNNPFESPAELSVVRANSPASKAGLKVGDHLVEAMGQPVSRQSQFKHALGPLYAGDTLHLVVERGTDRNRVNAEVQLVDKLPAYEFPFLGILLSRPPSDATQNPTVRFVYPDGPASRAGLSRGDQITAVAGVKVKSYETIAAALREFVPGDAVELQVRRGSEELKFHVTLGTLPEAIPGEVPPGLTAERGDAAEKPLRGNVPIKVAEFPNDAVAFVPEGYRPNLPHGVVVWLGPPSQKDLTQFIAQWKPICERDNLILLACRPVSAEEWQPKETSFVRKAIDELAKSYELDWNRVVVHGHEGGGAMAYVVALTNPDTIRGVAVVDAPLPSSISPPETNPMHRVAIYSALPTKGKFTSQANAGVRRLRELKYPVTEQTLGNSPRYLSATELENLARWIDSLDRL